jgi:hypothetical protein
VLLAVSLIALALQLPLSHAESGTETNSPSQTFAVALPELEGPVTLGIFSAKGDLVRLLYRDAAVDSIPAGLNGLIMTWDEKDASGKQVPPGTYRARGLVHGQVSVSKLLFHDRFWLSPASESGATNASSGNGSCSNTIMISSARDELLSTRAMIAIKATPLDKTVQISANTLPLLELPITPSTSPVLATLSKGIDAGTGVITVATGGETSSCTISGLDRIVPLEAGTLEIPPGTFHPAPVGEESRR